MLIFTDIDHFHDQNTFFSSQICLCCSQQIRNVSGTFLLMLKHQRSLFSLLIAQSWQNEYSSIKILYQTNIFIIYFGCSYLIFVSHISGFICLYVQPTLWFNLTSTLFSLFHNSVFLLHIPFCFARFFFLFYNQHPGFPWLHYGSGIHYFLHTITHQNNTWLSGEILPAIFQ